MTVEQKCNVHDAEIKNIRTEFVEYKTVTNKKLDEILDGLKPQFSLLQIMTFLFSLLVACVSIILYIETIKGDTRINQTEIETLKKQNDISDLRYDLILEKLNNIDKKVDVNAVRMDSQAVKIYHNK